MPSTYSPDLRIELIANGEKTGTWGTITNVNLGTIIEDAVSGLASVPIASANQALTALNGVVDQARCAAVSLSIDGGWGSPTDFSVYVPPVTKLYVIINDSGYTATVYASTVLGNTTAAGTGIAVPTGKSALLRCDGTDVVEQLDYVSGNFSVGATATTKDLVVSEDSVLTGPVTASSSAYLGGSQTASISNGGGVNAAVVTVSASPAIGSAITFSTTGTLPTPLAVGTTYYVLATDWSTTTFKLATSVGGSAIVTSDAGSGTHTVINVSLAVTPPAASNNTQIATTGYVTTAIDAILALTNWTLSETTATQTATFTAANPAVVSVTAAPANGTPVSFSSTGTLPGGITLNAPYYVRNRDTSGSPHTYLLSTGSGTAQVATITIATPGVVTVTSAPANNDLVVFSTSGALPTGLTAGTSYYVVNRTSTTFEVSATFGGSAIATSGSQSGTHTATWYTLVDSSSGSGSGTITETTSTLYFKYKTQNRLSLDLAGNLVVDNDVTAFGTP